MASQYNLELKATLDTAQVQQELQRLRSAQAASGSGENRGGGAAGAGGNFQRLDASLARLNQSIANLQRSIDQMNRFNQRSAQAAGRGAPVARGPSAPIIPGKEKSPVEQWTHSQAYQTLNKKMVDEMRSFVAANAGRPIIAKTLNKVIEDYGGGLDNPLFTEQFFNNPNVNKSWEDFKSYKKQREYHIEKYNQQAAQIQRQNKARMTQNRELATLIGGQLIGAAGGIATNLGYDTYGSVLTATGQGVTAGAGAAMASSLLGMGTKVAGVVGVVVGLASALSDLRQ